MKKAIILTSCLISSVNFSKAVDFDRFEVDAYNALPSSLVASKALERKGTLEKVLEEGKRVLQEYDSVDFMGVRLLHRHNDLKAGEVMVQTFEVDEKGPSFVTQNCALEAFPNTYPASWVLGQRQTSVFEYSTDENVREGGQYLEEHPSLFLKIEGVLRSNQLEEVLAPSIVSRSVYPQFAESDFLMEYNKTQKTESGVRYLSILRPSSEKDFKSSADQMVMTNWGFVGKPKMVGCTWYSQACIFDGTCGMVHYSTPDDVTN